MEDMLSTTMETELYLSGTLLMAEAGYGKNIMQILLPFTDTYVNTELMCLRLVLSGLMEGCFLTLWDQTDITHTIPIGVGDTTDTTHTVIIADLGTIPIMDCLGINLRGTLIMPEEMLTEIHGQHPITVAIAVQVFRVLDLLSLVNKEQE